MGGVEGSETRQGVRARSRGVLLAVLVKNCFLVFSAPPPPQQPTCRDSSLVEAEIAGLPAPAFHPQRIFTPLSVGSAARIHPGNTTCCALAEASLRGQGSTQEAPSPCAPTAHGSQGDNLQGGAGGRVLGSSVKARGIPESLLSIHCWLSEKEFTREPEKE